LLQEKNTIGKGACDNIRSKEKKSPKNSNAVEDKISFEALLKLLISNEVFN